MYTFCNGRTVIHLVYYYIFVCSYDTGNRTRHVQNIKKLQKCSDGDQGIRIIEIN